jgi:Type I phosphodiesterase / nucleotide pyrophosphatase
VRRLLPLALAAGAVLALLGMNLVSPADPYARPPGRVADVACRLELGVLIRMDRGEGPSSGDIALVPRFPNFVGNRLSHAGPWPAFQHVPLLAYGPGHVFERAFLTRLATLPAVAPTLAQLVGFSDPNYLTDEGPLTEALRTDAARPPRLVLVVSWESGGRNTLGKWPKVWSNLRRLMPLGTWYDNANVGSSPTEDGPALAAMGTGAFPRRTDIVDTAQRTPEGIRDPWAKGPALLGLPTLADLYDRSRGNEPLVGLVASDPAALGLIGHGSSLEGGDRDVVAMARSGPNGTDWTLPDDRGGRFYSPAGYLGEIPGPDRALARLDLVDGIHDHHWQGLDLKTADPLDTPAQVSFLTRALHAIVQHEGFGADDVPDLLFANYDIMRRVEGRFGLNSLQMRDSLRALDASLPNLVTMLDQAAGRGNWVMILAGDHGSARTVDVAGGAQVRPAELRRDLQERFGGGPSQPSIVQAIRPTEIWMHLDRLAAHGFSLNDVSRFLDDYTAGDAGVTGPDADRRVFAAALPGRTIRHLPCITS